jgi:HEAT repeat protein
MMSLRRVGLGVVTAVLAAAPHVGAQSIADRVTAVREGTVQMTYASRPDACGDGRDITALGKLFVVYPSVQGHGWSRMDCTFGPAQAVVTRRGGEVTLVRLHVGALRRPDASVIDLGTVAAREAAEYFLGLASTASGRVASNAIMAAAFADSADIWQRLLALARDENRARDARSSALYWLAGVAPPEAATPLATLVHNGGESRQLREGVLMTLGQLREGAGVPTLIEMTRRDGDDRWLRERAIFWLGNAGDDRGRATLRTLAASDTVGNDLRGQAIFALGFLDHDGANGPFLRNLYAKLEDGHLKDKVIQAVAQLDEDDDQRWLVQRVLDPNERVELRKQALFWRGQKQSAPLGDLIALYPRLDSRELKEHYVFVISQRRESDAVDKLIDVARNDPDREIRAKATFWLGQSRDPRAAKYLEDRISK